MPAKVTIQSGISAGTYHWIEKPVARIGSDPSSDVCLPSADVPSHALTLEYRDGLYRIYNRCNANVIVGTMIVEPGKAQEWPDADILQLNGDIELVLDLDDDPTPMSMETVAAPEYDVNGEETSQPELNYEEETTQVSADNSKLMLQLAVTVLCLLGCVGLLARESMKGSTSDQRKEPSLTAIVRKANESNTEPKLVQRLQHAESAVVRGNKKLARERFGKLRDDLVPQRQSFESAKQESELAILSFVEYRLGQLE